MDIEINGYRITSDDLNVIVYRKHIIDPTKAVGWKPGGPTDKRVDWRDPKYYSTTEKAFASLLDRVARNSEATTLAELLAELRAFKREMSVLIDAE